jgi:hypothetical protein
MTPAKGRLPSLSAALAGIPAGIQIVGPWTGRRQLMVRFAAEAETATIYTADALRGELARLSARSRYHSVAIVGGDALAEHEFLEKTFHPAGTLPLMLDHDGQRPESLYGLVDVLSLMQVSMDGTENAPSVERICHSIDIAARKRVAHAIAIVPDNAIGDAPLLRIVEQVHEASAASQIVVHPVVERAPEQDRRWVHWLERAMAVHEDVRIHPRWPVNTRPATPERETRNGHSG